MNDPHDHGGRTGLGLLACGCLTCVMHGQGGENAADAVPLELNVITSGTTAGFADDSDEVCPYTGSTAPDVYYLYVPTVDHNLTVDLCASAYDTKTYVYDSKLQLIVNVKGDLSCNDDACSSANGGMFRSTLDCVPMTADRPYFVVVDGWGGDAGDYTIELHDTEELAADPDACAVPPPCIVACPPGAALEGERCVPGLVPDDFNGGCNTSPAAFSPVACDLPVCGDVYFDGSLRDTDWYIVSTDEFCTFTWSAACEFEAVIGRINNLGQDWEGTDICRATFAEFDVGDPCAPLQTVSEPQGPGTWIFFIAPNFTDIFLCDAGGQDQKDYVATLTCACAPPPVPCPWDFNGNGQVDFFDLLEVLSNWGPCPA